ncbi:MAG: DUF2071 domain-containing protein [Flavipsychrobacter sp.]|nr:DUF2071 domain-containing protein [Flavipsychrobacter sp.]
MSVSDPSLVYTRRNAFLAANWEYLAMLNYKAPPAVLAPHIPPGTTLDLRDGMAYVSVVGFLFNDTRVMGVKWPMHVHFEEVNLRYYIKQSMGADEKRGVGFVSEIVPRRCIATIANTLYNEHYRALRMRHSLAIKADTINVRYEWRLNNKWNHIAIQAANKLLDIAPGSDEEYILEHYWGYNQLNANTTIVYGVEHPRWQVYEVAGYNLDADIANLYGKEFVPFIQGIQPASVFLARGSEVVVRKPTRLIVK